MRLLKNYNQNYATLIKNYQLFDKRKILGSPTTQKNNSNKLLSIK